MSLVLTTYNLSDWDTFSVVSKLPQTQQGAHTESSQLLRPIQTIESFLELLNNLPENQQLLLAAVQAEYFIADALEAGRGIADAALEWQKLTIELLNIQRQHRNRVQIFNLHQALAAPDKFCQILQDTTVFPAQNFNSSLSLLAACQYLTQQPELQNLNVRLQASSLALAENAQLHLDIEQVLSTSKEQINQLQQNESIAKLKQADAEAAWSHLQETVTQQLLRLQQQETEVQRHEEENKLLLTQYQALQATLEQQYIKFQTQEAELNRKKEEHELISVQCQTLQAALEQQQLKLQQQAKELADKKEEAELLIAQYQQLQGTLAQQQLTLQQQTTELAHKEDEAERLVTQCQQLQATLEQQEFKLHQQEKKLTAKTEERELIITQLQHQQEELQNKTSELQSKQDETELLLLQLHQVQEELELRNVQLQTQKLQIEKHISKEQWLRDNQSRAERKLKIAQTRLDESTHAIQILNEERNGFLAQLQRAEVRAEQLAHELKAEQQSNKHALFAKEKQYAKEIEKLERQLRQMKARAASAEFAGQLLQQELSNLRTSISWKFAIPIRAVGRLVKKTDSARDELLQQIGLLLTSEYFDVDWYLRIYPDVAENKINPAEHYLLFGAKEGRLPGPLFDGNWYLQQYPDVAAANINPLLHFIMHGQQEGRSSSPILLDKKNLSSEK